MLFQRADSLYSFMRWILVEFSGFWWILIYFRWLISAFGVIIWECSPPLNLLLAWSSFVFRDKRFWLFIVQTVIPSNPTSNPSAISLLPLHHPRASSSHCAPLFICILTLKSHWSAVFLIIWLIKRDIVYRIARYEVDWNCDFDSLY